MLHLSRAVGQKPAPAASVTVKAKTAPGKEAPLQSGLVGFLRPKSKLTVEQPLRAELLSGDQMKQYGRILAQSHVLALDNPPEMLLARLHDNAAVLADGVELVTQAVKAKQQISPAGEWLLDNFHLIEEQIHTAKRHLPRGYSRSLPRLSKGASQGRPRVYDLALETIAHGDGRVDLESLNNFVEAYQQVTVLTLGELWAIPIMLRLAIIENLRRVTSGISANLADRNLVGRWVDRLTDMLENDPKSLVLVLADMARSKLPMSSSFVAEFSRRLQGRGPALALPLTWIKQWLSEAGLTIERLVRAEGRLQAADQVSMGNSVGSLRLLSSVDWRSFVESQSRVESQLSNDPAGIYARMAFVSRDRYRHQVEGLAKRASLPESQVAAAAVELAGAAVLDTPSDPAKAHVGYYLVDDGLEMLRRKLRLRTTPASLARDLLRRFPLELYLGSAGLLTGLLIAALLSAGASIWGATASLMIGLLCLPAAVQWALELLNLASACLVKPQALPRMDFSQGLPRAARTLVVVPAQLHDGQASKNLAEALEVRFLGNRDENLFFALLTDFRDAATEILESDAALLKQVETAITALNHKYAGEGEDRFFLFHRPRLYNSVQNTWMGFERKRGKIAQLNSFLMKKDRSPFCSVVGDTAALDKVAYMITLDTDTQLPRDTARQLVGCMFHPLNRPVMEAGAPRVTRGYGILQPSVDVSLPGTCRSWYARLHGASAGLDPYTRAASDLYQDLFREGSFVGKGIHDVAAFEQMLAGRLPENRILSHDLLEGCLVRSGLVSDVHLYEESPGDYGTDVARRLRWVRGDWQIAAWLRACVPGFSSAGERNPLHGLSQWKLLDNLRRSLVPASTLMMFFSGWAFLPSPGRWSLGVLAVFLTPIMASSLQELSRFRRDATFGRHLHAWAFSALRRLGEAGFRFSCLPFEAWSNLKAIARTLWRLTVSQKRLLEWNPPGGHADGCARLGVSLRLMQAAPLICAAVAVLLGTWRPAVLGPVAPFLVVWFVSPLLAWSISRPRSFKASTLTQSQVLFLHRLARKTWNFFDDLVGPEDHWLPPDNFQETHGILSVHRTSPTNMGLALLANLSAYDFGYLSESGLIRRSAHTLESMEGLPRYRGHFYNWYDTRTLEPLPPHYVSTVDSGNLCGHLLTLREGLLALKATRPENPRTLDGIADTLRVIRDLAGGGIPAGLEDFVRIHSEAFQLPPQSGEYGDVLEALARASLHFESARLFEPEKEMVAWAWALQRQCVDARDDFFQARAGDASRRRDESLNALAARLEAMAEMDFSFLYDETRHLFRVGFHTGDQRLDAGCYDLLASEARLASFVAIARGQVPQENWFSLSRMLTSGDGGPVLLSWSGSMFEYLMPLLVMPTYENSLLDQTCKAVVRRQISYAARRGVPWGISESGYHLIDSSLQYQYRAFGVPGLGLKRGLDEELVVAPYACALALMVAPSEACHNLHLLAQRGLEGLYGLYEAVDFTPSRLFRGEKGSIVRSYMAHHQGMTLLALEQALLGKLMPRRFESRLNFQATLLLLQERIPKTSLYFVPPASRSRLPSTVAGAPPPMRTYRDPNSAHPELQLLSNGRYHVMVTHAGGGYSRWKNLAVTRWHEDATRDSLGSFCYLRDLDSGAVWSASYQPTQKRADDAEAIFSEGRVEFRRRDGNFETLQKIAVSSEDDIELRRVQVTNRAGVARHLDVTSYAEVVLAPPEGDALHPAFSNLFVETEIVRPLQALLCFRRPRGADEQPVWMFHLMAVHGGENTQVSYETDRRAFLGRGNDAASAAAMQTPGPLAGGEGAVLDPIVAIRAKVRLKPAQSVVIDMVTGVAESRAEALQLVEKYRDRSLADRVLELSWTHSQVLLHQIGATESDARLYNRMANSVLYADATLRPDPALLAANRKGQSGLWGYAVSGDLPIVLLRVSNPENLNLVRQCVQAHAYWRLKGLAVDLVIWNESQSGYQQVFQEEIQGLIAARLVENRATPRGEIYVRQADQIGAEDRVLFQSVARAVYSDQWGGLLEQLNRHQERKSAIQSPGFAVTLPPQGVTDIPRRELVFRNGLGGFTPDGREYVVTLSRGQTTPAPWVNVLANPHFGCVLSESGMAHTFGENAHEFRLTPWNNDPVCDFDGEALYLRDEIDGRYWSPTPGPRRGDGTYVVRHGFGYSVFETTQAGIHSELWVYVSVDAPVKFSVLKLRNDSPRRRLVSATGYVEWVLGDLPAKTAMHVVTDVDIVGGAVLASNPYNTEFPDRVGFFSSSQSAQSFSGDRTEFLGRNGSIRSPAGMQRSTLSGKVGAALDPCAAVRVLADLEPGQGHEFVFTLGIGRGAEETDHLARRFRGSTAARNELKKVWDHWNRVLGAVGVETPDAAFNIMANGWLLYQTLACRVWGRSGFYQSGGAFGFRDQLQDVAALIHTRPDLARQQLLRCAGRQFPEGDVQHWWHPPSGRGVRTLCSDDYLWLPSVACRYSALTGDTGVWRESTTYLSGRPLNPAEDSYYDLPGVVDRTDTLYTHCRKALQKALVFGTHGLPLMGSGDWNDGMDEVGRLGQGESVWLGFFLYQALLDFAPVAGAQKDLEFESLCLAQARKLRLKLEDHAWDGQWYRRAYFDNGDPLGSADNAECRIDSIAQSWSVLSGAADPKRGVMAMNALDLHLVDRERALVKLLDPPFDKSGNNPGYIQGYVPGARENGGQYTHAAVWAAMAFAAQGDSKRAWELTSMINPINHSVGEESMRTYQVEPYVMAADLFSQGKHAGRGGWTWYTGSAGWMYRLMLESILGLHLEVDQLRLLPCIPQAWDGFKIHYRYRGTVYHLSLSRVAGNGEESDVMPDGGWRIPLTDDGGEHFVEINI